MKASCVFLLALSIAAQDTMPRSTPTAKNPVGTGVRDATVDYFDSMSDYFRNSQRAVRAIHEKGIPVGEIPAVLMIARRSSASPNQIIDARNSGKSFSDIARQHNVTLPGPDFATEANLIFLSEYHGRPIDQVRQLHAKGADFIALNQEFRRDGSSQLPKATERSRTQPKN
ncbi:MAG TPA: hypothetical protein VER03_15560 [Bryobacteraceae bacterium]|nr:hypothetical protein [Bryobacteraceae bacterium]